jgi:hypothetical protein
MFYDFTQRREISCMTQSCRGRLQPLLGQREQPSQSMTTRHGCQNDAGGAGQDGENRQQEMEWLE